MIDILWSEAQMVAVVVHDHGKLLTVGWRSWKAPSYLVFLSNTYDVSPNSWILCFHILLESGPVRNIASRNPG